MKSIYNPHRCRQNEKLRDKKMMKSIVLIPRKKTQKAEIRQSMKEWKVTLKNLKFTKKKLKNITNNDEKIWKKTHKNIKHILKMLKPNKKNTTKLIKNIINKDGYKLNLILSNIKLSKTKWKFTCKKDKNAAIKNCVFPWFTANFLLHSVLQN